MIKILFTKEEVVLLIESLKLSYDLYPHEEITKLRESLEAILKEKPNA